MNCHVCGGEMLRTVTELPFQRAEGTIVIIKAFPGSCVTRVPSGQIRRSLPDREIQPLDERRVQLGGVFGVGQRFRKSRGLKPDRSLEVT